MSGLLVKSTAVMKENLEEMQRLGIKIPVMLGGAALTKNFVDDYCRPIYDGAIFFIVEMLLMVLYLCKELKKVESLIQN